MGADQPFNSDGSPETMTTESKDGYYRSTLAVPLENKPKLEELIKQLKLASMADLLNMLVESVDTTTRHLEFVAQHYMVAKAERRADAARLRETTRLREKLAELEKK